MYSTSYSDLTFFEGQCAIEAIEVCNNIYNKWYKINVKKCKSCTTSLLSNKFLL